jgi:hypothetical protein
MLNARVATRQRSSCADWGFRQGQHGQLCTAVQFAVRETAEDEDGEGGYKSVILNLNSESKSGKSLTFVFDVCL